MKTKHMLSLVLLCVATMLSAQNSIIKGNFRKAGVQNIMSKDITVGIVENGSLKPVLQNLLTKDTYGFQFGVDHSIGILGKVVFAGTDGEYYPLYVGNNETIDLQVDKGCGKLVGKLGRENATINEWLAIVNPLRSLVYTPEGRKATADVYHKTIEEVTRKAETFIGQLHTGNSQFDRTMKATLPYMLMQDVLAMFGQGISFDRQADYPSYIKRIFADKAFADADIDTHYPQVFDLMLMYGFGREIIYNNKMGATAELMVNDITNPELRSEFITACMEKGYVTDWKAYDSQYGSMVSAKDRSRYTHALNLIRVNTPGEEAVDFEYPDLEGKMHRLSDYKGKVVVVDVWATWCVPCKKEIPALTSLEKEMEGKDVVFISLSIDTDAEAWEKYVTSNHLSGVQLISYNRGSIKDDYLTEYVPRFMVFSKDGKTVTTNGPRPSTPQLKELILKQL